MVTNLFTIFVMTTISILFSFQAQANSGNPTSMDELHSRLSEFVDGGQRDQYAVLVCQNVSENIMRNGTHIIVAKITEIRAFPFGNGLSIDLNSYSDELVKQVENEFIGRITEKTNSTFDQIWTAMGMRSYFGPTGSITVGDYADTEIVSIYTLDEMGITIQ